MTQEKAGKAEGLEQNDAQTQHPTSEQLKSFSEVELIRFVEDCVNEDNPLEVSSLVTQAKDLFESRKEKQYQQDLDKFLEAGNDKIDFSPAPDPEKDRFYKAYKAFKARKNDLLKSRKQALENNLAIKQEIIGALKAINEASELKPNLRKVNALQDKWKATGPVPRSHADKINQTYHFHLKKFFTSLDVYSQFRELDRKKNLDTCKHICEKTEALTEMDNMENARHLLRKYQDEWKKTGPVPQDQADEFEVRFQNAVTRFYDKLERHKAELEQQREKNLDKKQALLEQAEAFRTFDSEYPKDWIQQNEAFNELLDAWKQVGPVPQGKHKALEGAFRDIARTFNRNKNQFFKTLKKNRQQTLRDKTALCERVEAILEEKDLPAFRSEVIEAQRKWKTFSLLPMKDAKPLNERFYKACDRFFELLDEAKNAQEAEKEANIAKKEAFLEEVAQKTPPETADEAKTRVKTLRDQWKTIDRAPAKAETELNQRFARVLNDLFKDIDDPDLPYPELLAYKAELESYLDRDNAGDLFDNEARKLNKQLKSTEEALQKLRDNIAMFQQNSDFGESLLKNYKDEIREKEETVEQLKLKRRILREVEDRLD